ncbi:predicted protein [Uncinocarpus reesii 1704]|uniref:ubiquitinyl hydrolase 1 n=1 Tax=Uncinocarpus reesii (strain UAMH 1704) TaxID=336963 RepID=C4JWP6_UNCRE|nr:uncharacterized protein UREG_06988 [Uncinocarpus reesii 1704]EEP82123.1 predicted protein [Uncinocarpus reesii 1704]
MDILNIDFQLKNDASLKRLKSGKKSQSVDESEAGFHFIAFVPAKGKVWKFDGLERQPQSLGNYDGGDWLGLAKPEIQSRMAEYEEDQIEFSILSLSKDPLDQYVSRLAFNVNRLIAIDEQLLKHQHHQDAVTSDDATIVGPDLSFGLTQEFLEHATLPEVDIEGYKTMSKEHLLELRKSFSTQQHQARAAVKEEMQAREADNAYAAKRRHDYGPAVQTWLQALLRQVDRCDMF